jgi:hypothetical protein
MQWKGAVASAASDAAAAPPPPPPAAAAAAVADGVALMDEVDEEWRRRCPREMAMTERERQHHHTSRNEK